MELMADYKPQIFVTRALTAINKLPIYFMSNSVTSIEVTKNLSFKVRYKKTSFSSIFYENSTLRTNYTHCNEKMELMAAKAL